MKKTHSTHKSNQRVNKSYRVEAMMTNITVERFELVDDSPENEESCRICLVRFLRF